MTENDAYLGLLSAMGTLIAEVTHCMRGERPMSAAVSNAVADVRDALLELEKNDG